MNVLQAQDIIDLYSRCESLGLASKALAILARAGPHAGKERHAARTVGQRDIELLALRTGTFGPLIDIVSTCPACAAPVEVGLTAEALGLDPGAGEASTPQLECSVGGHALRLRAVTAGDLAQLETYGQPEALRRELIARCVLAVDGVIGASVPEECIPEIERHLQAMDPAAEIELGLTCPDCATRWSELLDPPALMWDTISIAASRLLADVADLARVYHWSESDILGMPARRRRFYLEAAGL